MLRPDEIVSPTPAWAFTFELSPPGSPWGASSITTRANNQFPWPDFHRLDKQSYRLQTKSTKVKGIEYIILRVLRALRGEMFLLLYCMVMRQFLYCWKSISAGGTSRPGR